MKNTKLMLALAVSATLLAGCKNMQGMDANALVS